MIAERAGVLLAGYFGYGNAGDELIAQVVRRVLPSPCRIPGVDVSRWNPLALLAALRGSRALVFGGGELFQTRSSRRSLWYYTALPRLAKLSGATFFAYGMGIDPGLSVSASGSVARALNSARRIWFRDKESLRRYHAAGGSVPASVVPDPVWACGGDDIPPAPDVFRRCLWIPRRPLTRERLVSLSAETGAASSGVMLLHPSQDAAEFGSLPGLISWKNPADIPALINDFDVVISMRYHGILLAALAGRPSVALAAHPKVAQLADELGLPSLRPDVSTGRLSEAVAEAFQKRGAVRAAALRLVRESRQGLDDFRRTLAEGA